MEEPSHFPGKYSGLPRATPWGVLPIIVFLALAVGTVAVAEDSPFPLSLSAGSHSLTVPWHPGPVTNRFNPALIAGTDRTLRPGGVRLYYAVNLGFFENYWWMTGIFLDTEVGVGHAFPYGFHTDVRLGVGYLHYFWRRKTLELKDGAYVPARDWGTPSLMVPFSVILGYRGNPSHPLVAAPFVCAQWAVQTPFTDESPAMTHFFFSAGVRMELGRAQNNGK